MIVSEKERGLGVKFCRIRRITGYLVGDMSTWGSAKQAEERDRVKHVSCTGESISTNATKCETVMIMPKKTAVAI